MLTFDEQARRSPLRSVGRGPTGSRCRRVSHASSYRSPAAAWRDAWWLPGGAASLCPLGYSCISFWIYSILRTLKLSEALESGPVLRVPSSFV